jgi:hypothetical protein
MKFNDFLNYIKGKQNSVTMHVSSRVRGGGRGERRKIRTRLLE